MVAGFIAIVIIFSILGVLAARQVTRVSESADRAAGQAEAVEFLQAAKVAIDEQEGSHYELLIRSEPGEVDAFIEAGGRRQQATAEARTNAQSAQELHWFDGLDRAAAAFDNNFLNEMVPAWTAGDHTAALEREPASDAFLEEFNDNAQLLTESFNNRYLEAQSQADLAASEAKTYLGFAAATGLGLSLIVILAAVTRLSRPVARLKQASIAMARGDLRHRVHLQTGDEIADLGDTFNLMADSMEHKIRQLTSLSEIALAVSSELDWERVVNIVMEKGMDLTQSQASAIAFYDEDRRAFTNIRTQGLSSDFTSKMQFRPGGLAESVLLGEEAVFSDDIQASHRLSQLARDEGIKSFVCLPLKVRLRRLGVFYVYSKVAESYSREGLSALSILANQAAIAIQNARIFERTQEEAITDGLTGLYNQKYFYTRLREETERASRTQKPLSIIFCDLDKFKSFNDLNGHALGDGALTDVAGVIKESKRTIDIAARYGGEEFALILPETDSSGAQIIAHRIRRRVAGFSFEAKAKSCTALSASIGVSSYPEDAIVVQELVDKADWSMYYGKRHGGNRVTLFHEVAEDYGKENPLEDLVREELHLAAIQALAQSVDQRSPFTQRHAESVARLASSLAAELNLSADEVYMIRIAGLLHDVGFVSVPEEIVNKREHLTPEEWERIRQHPEVSANILGHISSLESFLPAIRHHHEHYDGEGYPDGLARDRIPLGARILAVADAYQAMVCDRPYRQAMTSEQAILELELGSGSQFDPMIVQTFISLMRAHEAKVEGV